MRQVPIYTTPMSLRFNVLPNGYLPDMHIGCHDLLGPFTTTYYDRQRRMYVPGKKYRYYSLKEKMVYLPLYYLETVLTFFRDKGIDYKVIPLDLPEGEAVEINMIDGFKPKNKQQGDAIEHLAKSSDQVKGVSLNTGCLDADTVISFNRAGKGFRMTIEQAYLRINGRHKHPAYNWDISIPTKVRSMTAPRNINLNTIHGIVYSGRKRVIKLTTQSGATLTCTPDHKIYALIDGWVPAKDMVGKLVYRDMRRPISNNTPPKRTPDIQYTVTRFHPHARSVLCNSTYKGRPYQWRAYRIERHRAVYEAKMNNMSMFEYKSALKDPERVRHMKFVDPKIYDIHHVDHDHYNNDPTNLMMVTKQEHYRLHRENHLKNLQTNLVVTDKIVKIEDIGSRETYDIQCHAPHHNFTANGIVVHNSGKTVTTIKHLSHVGKRALIGVQGLTDQWERAILEWTTLNEDDIYVIKGGPSVTKLLTRIDKSLFPKIIIYSIATLRPYSQDASAYENYPLFDDLAEKLNVGIRAIDETHLNFFANYIMDLRLRVRETVVLTATFDVSDPTVKKVFDNHYPPRIRFGEGQFERYIEITAYGYRSGFDDIPAYAYSSKDGYSHVMLENWLLSKKGKLRKITWIFDTVYRPIIESHYLNTKKDGEKLLMLCETVAMCEFLALKIRECYPELITNIYIGETDDSIYEISEVIVSTTKSSGTAKDIKKLRTVFQTTSIRSAPQNIQNLGRLRELPGGDTPHFCYVFNKAVEPQVKHHEVRRVLFEPRGKTYKVIDLHR